MAKSELRQGEGQCGGGNGWGNRTGKVFKHNAFIFTTPLPFACALTPPLLPHFPPTPAGHLVAGALAGAASRTATAPLETLRLAVMTGSLEASDLMQGAAVLMARGGGWKALFRGNAVNVMR